MEFSFDLHGMDEWFTKYGSSEKAVRAFLGVISNLIKADIEARTPVDFDSASGKAKGFGGHIQESWNRDIMPSSAIIYTDVFYGPTLEEGNYPRVGPRTAAGPGGIFSKQAIGGIIGPMLADPDIIGGFIEMAKKKVPENVANLFGD